MLASSPKGFDAKGLDRLVRANQGQSFIKRLGGNQSIPRIAIDQRQTTGGSSVKWIDREQFGVGLDQMGRYVEIVRQPELANRHFEIDLVDAGNARANPVCWIIEQSANRRFDLVWRQQSKQDRIGIEQISHAQPLESNVSEGSATPSCLAGSKPAIACSLDQASNGSGNKASSGMGPRWASLPK